MQESSISEKIKELRTDLKMNQKNFSAAIGIRQSTLSSYENGVVTPSNDVLLENFCVKSSSRLRIRVSKSSSSIPLCVSVREEIALLHFCIY